VSSKDALETALKYNLADYSSVSELFGSYTSSSYAESNDVVGKAEYQDVPAWVVTFHDDCPTPVGGLVQPPPADEPCNRDWVVVVNATSGAYMESYN
jgi:hypothetical protein